MLPEAPAATGGAAFAGRVAGVFGTRVVQLISTIVVSFLLARLLGPEGRGVYAVLILVPTTLFAIGQLGLPQAMVFYAGRGARLRDLERHTLTIGLPVSATLVVLTLVALPVLEKTVLRTAPDDLLRLALLVVPLRLIATLAGSVLYGRQAFRVYNLILAAQSVLAVALVLLIVGIVGAGVFGALGAYLLMLAVGTAAVLVQLDRVRRAAREGAPVSGGQLFAYGLRLYPASVGNFFGYRADVFLLGWLVGSSAQIGLYSVAVSLAELVFNVPDSVSTVLFPRMASADREEADRLAPAVSRLTVLVTLGAAVAMVPASWLALWLLLPAFLEGMPALVVILPGIVSLAVAKVLTSYLSGIDRLTPIAGASLGSMGLNIVLNLVFIPAWGIVGAAAASLASYTVYGALMVWFAARESGASWSAFILPTPDDFRRIAAFPARFGSGWRDRSAG